MTSYDYPPWTEVRTAPSRIERADKPSKWDKLKPWRRSQRRKKQPQKTPLSADAPPMYNGPSTKLNPFAVSTSPNPFAMGVFPGYGMHRSPDDMFRRDHDFSPRGAVSDISPISKPREKDPPGIFDPPPYKTSRPPLSNIFTMFEPPLEEQRSRGSASSKERFDSPKVTPVSSTKQLTSSSENTSLSNLQAQRRRHSTPGPIFTPVSRPLRSSDQSVHSDTSSERYKRRVRRNEAVRVLPLLPRRDHYIIPEEEYSPILPKQRPPPPPPQQQQQQQQQPPRRQKTPDTSTHATDMTDGGGTPGGRGPSSSYYDGGRPSWPQDQQSAAAGRQMLELEEELRVDEPYEQEPPIMKQDPMKHFEDSFQHHYYHQPPALVPATAPAPVMVEEVKRPGKLVRKKSKKVKNKEKAGLKMPVKMDTPANDEDEIKGFDGFMMY